MENLTKQQKNFLENYAHTLNATKSALDGGYSENVAAVQAKMLLARAKYQQALNSIIEQDVDKLEIPKAFILKKYLQIIDFASGESKARSEFSECGTQGANKAPVRDFREPEDAALLLKALDGLQRFLDRAKNEGESEKSSAFWQIDNIDCSKI